jgi:dTDP-4-amino-4,6-dideoxygalactose transaminase
VIFVEDAAQALGATCRDRPLGSFGALSAISFHQTKNVTAGEGGALVVKDADRAARARALCRRSLSFPRPDLPHMAGHG